MIDQDENTLIQEKLIRNLLEEQKKQIESENKRMALEQMRVNFQKELLDRQKAYNDSINKVVSLCEQIQKNIKNFPNFMSQESRNWSSMISIIEQICSILLYKNHNMEERDEIQQIQKKLEHVSSNFPVINVVGNINSGEDTNL